MIVVWHEESALLVNVDSCTCLSFGSFDGVPFHTHE